jgi:hypothetical protein
MICPNCGEEISFWRNMFKSRNNKICNHCQTEIKIEKEGLYNLAHGLMGAVGGLIVLNISPILYNDNRSWQNEIVFWIALIITGLLLEWLIWRYWKVIRKNQA